MVLRIADRTRLSYWEVHLWLNEGKYRTALFTDSGDTEIRDEAEAERLFGIASKTYPTEQLKLVKYTAEIIRRNDA